MNFLENFLALATLSARDHGPFWAVYNALSGYKHSKEEYIRERSGETDRLPRKREERVHLAAETWYPKAILLTIFMADSPPRGCVAPQHSMSRRTAPAAFAQTLLHTLTGAR